MSPEARGLRRPRLLRKSALLFAALSLALLGAACRPSSIPRSAQHPLAGDAAPAFQEIALSAREVGIPGGDRTRVTVVDFWASWCTACEETIPVLDELWRDRKRDGVMVIGVSVDESPEEAAIAATRLGASFPIVVNQRLAGRYAVAQIPLTFVVDRRGTVRWVGRDPSAMRQAVEYVLYE